MNIRNLLPVAALAALSFPAGLAAQEGGRPFTVTMTGAAERPGPGDPDGTGTAELRVNAGQKRVCYTLTVSGIDPATAAHIHRGAPDAAGPVVVPLAAPTSGTSHDCATISRDLAQELIRDPGAFYVNVHSAAFPSGAIRAQLSR
jgi:CHRD domain